MKRISLLGICANTIPVVFDLLAELKNQENIDIYLNKKFDIVPFTPIKEIAYTIHSVGTQLPGDDAFLFGVSGPKIKQAIFADFLECMQIHEGRYTSLVHKSAYIAPSSVISNGVLVQPHVVVSSQTLIDFGVSIKRGSLIGHHNHIGAFTDINPGVVLSGNVTIGKGCKIGSGAVLRDHISIGENTVIGMGSVVTKNIPANSIAYGNPCKVMQEL